MTLWEKAEGRSFRDDLGTTGEYRLFEPQGPRNQRQQSLPDGTALEVIHLPLPNPLRSQPDEIVLIEPFIKRDQVLGLDGSSHSKSLHCP